MLTESLLADCMKNSESSLECESLCRCSSPSRATKANAAAPEFQIVQSFYKAWNVRICVAAGCQIVCSLQNCAKGWNLCLNSKQSLPLFRPRFEPTVAAV